MTIAGPLLIISGMHLGVHAVKRTNKYGPMSQAHLMSFELIPLAPLNQLRPLQGMTTGSP